MAKSFQSRRNSHFRQEDEFDQRVIEIARVTRVVAGGKRMRFRACVVIGDSKGRIGMGLCKGADVSAAVNKAVTAARKNLIHVDIVNETISHHYKMKYKAALILIKPAPKGTGIKAGGPLRSVLEISGLKNVVGKMLGSKNKVNNVKALLAALKILKKPKNNQVNNLINQPKEKSARVPLRRSEASGSQPKADQPLAGAKNLRGEEKK
jgi:small subunit ribosomal protein S5